MFSAEAAGWFLEHAWLIPLIPGAAFAVIILFGKFEVNGKRVLPWAGAEVGLASMVVSLVLAIGTTYQWIHHVRGVVEAEPVIKSWTWWQIGGAPFGLGEHIDGLAVMLLLLVTFISTLVQIYSLEYVRGDRRYTHFFASITLFSAGMLTMVLAENMVQLILGWEIMGLCSFLLIGHWWEEEANARAAVKAFLTVRVGDVGMLVGTAIMFGASGTFTIRGLHAWANNPSTGHTVLLWASIALFIAAIGKSGQFPLHTWLPDAMAGPTPVSSLLHSSTMVVAGVFLVARLYPVFHAGLMINVAGQHFNLIAVIGGITVLIAAALAFVQNDIKKVLAYSTVSQLGYMMMGLGVGAWVPAVFHIFTHAFFKCCLFLCAGSVAHTGSHHSFDMKKDMGGLAKKMPVTFITWILATRGIVRGAVVQRLLLQGRDHRLGRALPLSRVHDRRSDRRFHDHRVHDPRHLPHVLRRAARRRRPFRSWPRRSSRSRRSRRARRSCPRARSGQAVVVRQDRLVMAAHRSAADPRFPRRRRRLHQCTRRSRSICSRTGSTLRSVSSFRKARRSNG